MENSYIYTGHPITPKYTLNIGERTLKSDTDFDVEFSDNIDVGTAHVTIKGKGKFTGVIRRTFEIKPVPARSLAFFADNTEFEYTGEPCLMKVAVKFGDIVLEEGKDYAVEYQDNIEPGKANARITFQGNYTGIMTIPFQIVGQEEQEPEVDSFETDITDIGESTDTDNADDTGESTNTDNAADTDESTDTDSTVETEENPAGENDVPKADPLINCSEVSSLSAQPGDTVRIYAKAEGGAGGYTYAIYYRKAVMKKWRTAQDFSDNAEIGLKLLMPVKYVICVKARDSAGKVEKKYFEISVTETEETASALSEE